MDGPKRSKAKAGGKPSALAFEGREDPPLFARDLRPHQSLSRQGARRVVAWTAAGLGVSLVPFLGSTVGWALLPFLLGALLALDAGIRRSYRDGTLREEVRLWPDLIAVNRVEPNGKVKTWRENPYWVRTKLRQDGRVEDYLTLKGQGREIELGAFLTPEARVTLEGELSEALAQAKSLQPS